MGFYNYNTLVATKTTTGSIANWVNDDAVPSVAILEEAQQKIYRRLRTRDMIGTATTGTITTSASTITLPSDYIAALMIQITGTDAAVLTRKTPSEVRTTYQWDGNGVRVTGKPDLYYVDNAVVQLDVPADQNYPFSMLYYARPALLGTATTTNFLTDKCITALRAMCLSLAAEWKKNTEDREYYLALAYSEIDDMNVESDRELRGLYSAVEPI